MANNYDGERIVQLKHLDTVVARFNTELGATFRSAKVSGNTVSFFNSKDKSGTAVFSFDLPEALLLDQTATKVVNNFTWSALTYPNSTNPNLDGKAVFVMAIKGENNSIAYSFVDMSKLADIYTAADKSVVIDDYEVAVNISQANNNALALKDDGLHVDISGKIDKVTNAVQGNLPIFGVSGALADSNVTFASNTDIDNMLTNVFGS